MENQKNSTKILWVDDDINTLFLKLHLDDLQDDGFTVLRAENPDEVESLLQENKDIKMIITDNSMPTWEKISVEESRGGMRTGLVLLQNLLQKPELNHIKKVMFTALDDGETQRYCKENNVPYLKKERYLSDTFLEEIKKILSQN